MLFPWAPYLFLTHTTMKLGSLQAQKSKNNPNPVCFTLLPEEYDNTAGIDFFTKMKKVPKSFALPSRS